MSYFEVVLVLVIVALGFWVWKLYQDKRQNESEIKALEKEKNEYEELGKGLTEYQQKLQEKKEQAKVKIMDMFTLRQTQGKEGKISNKEMASALGVSRATVARYFNELEAEGKAEQVGKSGRNVFYQGK